MLPHNDCAPSAGGLRQFDVRSVELAGAGYRWEPLGEGLGYLHWKTKVRAVTCDAPVLAQGTSEKPVVLDFDKGRNSPDRTQQVAAK